MNILADKNISCIAEACKDLGDVQFYEGRNIHRTLLEWADVLLCRSTIQVNEELLKGTKIRFVATATSGSEHVDERYLASRGIVFSHAAGSNARSVAEYVFTALFSLASNKSMTLLDKSIGIIGVGHIGTWVKKFAEQLGMKVILNDPPRKRQTADDSLKSIDEALAADIITLHPALTFDGSDPTFHLLNEDRLKQVNPSAIFINTSRGAVVDTEALFTVADKNLLRNIVLDVFEDEPIIPLHLLQYVDIATSHVAGHSHDGKLLGTRTVYESLCSFLYTKPIRDYRDALPGILVLKPMMNARRGSVEEIVSDILKIVYDIRRDDRALRKTVLIPPDERRIYFDNLRGNYPVRREFSAYHIDGSHLPHDVQHILRALGFNMV